MITINTDHGLVNVNSWEDVINIAGFNPNLDSSKHKLSTIIGRYLLPEQTACGLKKCHKKHAKGYVVSTESGAVTNIGKDCGKKYFGVDFEDLSKKFDRDLDEKEMRERLATFSFGLEDLEARIKEMRGSTYGADWVYKRVIALQTRGRNVPDDVINLISGMVRTGTGTLIRPRFATPEEIDRFREMGVRIKDPHIIEEQVGLIAGFEALYPEYDLKKILILDLEENINKFKALNQDMLTFEGLKHWSKWIGTIDSTLDKAEEAINHGQRLLLKDNLIQFNQVLKRADCDLFKGFLKTL